MTSTNTIVEYRTFHSSAKLLTIIVFDIVSRWTKIEGRSSDHINITEMQYRSPKMTMFQFRLSRLNSVLNMNYDDEDLVEIIEVKPPVDNNVVFVGEVIPPNLQVHFLNCDDDSSIEFLEVKPPEYSGAMLVEAKPKKRQMIVTKQDNGASDRKVPSPKMNPNQTAIKLLSSGNIMKKDSDFAKLMDPNNKRIFEEEKERLKKATKKSLHNLIRAETQEKHNSDHVDMIGMRNMYNKIIRFLEKDTYLLSWDQLW